MAKLKNPLLIEKELKKRFGDEIELIGFVDKSGGVPEWVMLKEELKEQKRLSKLKLKIDSNGKESFQIDETVKIVAVKSLNGMFYAMEYPVGTLLIKNSFSNKVYLVSEDYKYVIKKEVKIEGVEKTGTVKFI